MEAEQNWASRSSFNQNVINTDTAVQVVAPNPSPSSQSPNSFAPRDNTKIPMCEPTQVLSYTPSQPTAPGSDLSKMACRSIASTYVNYPSTPSPGSLPTTINNNVPGAGAVPVAVAQQYPYNPTNVSSFRGNSMLMNNAVPYEGHGATNQSFSYIPDNISSFLRHCVKEHLSKEPLHHLPYPQPSC